MVVTSSDLKEMVADEPELDYGGGDVRDSSQLGWIRVSGSRQNVESLVSKIENWTYTAEPPLSAVEKSEEENKFYIIPIDS